MTAGQVPNPSTLTPHGRALGWERLVNVHAAWEAERTVSSHNRDPFMTMPVSGGVEAVIFDVGGVLVESPFAAALRWGARWDLPMEAFEILYAEYSAVPGLGDAIPLWHQVETGSARLQDFLEMVQAQFVEVLPSDHPGLSLTADDFNPFAEASLHPEMVDCARALSDSGRVVSILTNNVHEWRQWRQLVPIDLFVDVVDSCEVGLRKPDPAIYRLACERARISPERALFVDDHAANVEAARALGLGGLHVGEDLVPAVEALMLVAGSSVPDRLPS
jgi:epoxide hydrolase-like predicted phosphatase